jgi:hypothetical protein
MRVLLFEADGKARKRLGTESKPPQAVTVSAQKSAIDTMSALLYRTWCRYSFLMRPAPRTMNQAIDDVEEIANILIFYL